MKLKGSWIRGPSFQKKFARIAGMMLGGVCISFFYANFVSAADGNNSLNNLSNTFCKIINLAGYVTFILGYIYFKS